MRGRKGGGTATGVGVIYHLREGERCIIGRRDRDIHAVIVKWKKKNCIHHPLLASLIAPLVFYMLSITRSL